MDEVSLRVQRVIEKVALSKSEFSARTGISAVILSHISSGRNKVSLATVQQILQAYPQLSPDYLVLGKGGMFLSKDESSKKQIIQSLALLSESITAFTEQSNRQIQSLISKIEKE